MLPIRWISIALACVNAWSARGYAQKEVIVYGQNSPDWNDNLGVTATRGTCSLRPGACLKTVPILLNGQHTKRFYLNLVANPATVADYALQFSNLSRSEPRLYEIGLDDFPDHWFIWCQTPAVQCANLLKTVIQNTRSANSNLKFGVTIYADQLSRLLASKPFAKDLRAMIDTVHLYFEYRGDIPKLTDYLDESKRNFPNAQTILGLYPHDRIDYLPCTGPGSMPCSQRQEMELYKQQLETSKRLLDDGEIAGIEFYPGHFGWEDKWEGWNSPRVCGARRRPECIATTRAMHSLTLQVLTYANPGTLPR